MTVSCITDTPPSTLSIPLSIEEPPFIISSTTDKPFLARITLTWAGYQNAPMEVEHWVELDPFHTSLVNPVLGDEQVQDIELDRHTELLPIRRSNGRNNSRSKNGELISNGETAAISEPGEPCKQQLTVRHQKFSSCDPNSDYVNMLKSLLPRYPLTMKGVHLHAASIVVLVTQAILIRCEGANFGPPYPVQIGLNSKPVSQSGPWSPQGN
jgi:hypothetical protein